MKMTATAAVTAAVCLGGCTTTAPAFHYELQEPAPGVSARKSAITVGDIRDHIYCELKAAGVPNNQFITVALTLQVDDGLDVTPSLAYTQLLHAPRVSVVTALSGDLGGARKRTFTATYTINSTEMNAAPSAPRDDGANCGLREQVLDLRGDLGIKEIVADGRLTTERQASPNHDSPGLIVEPDGAGKSGPTYASQIQFVLTRAIGSFGPVWTLHHWKGGGADKTGLFSGKRVDTDSVILTFAPRAGGAKANPALAKATLDAKAKAEAQAQVAAAARAQADGLATKSHQFDALVPFTLPGQKSHGPRGEVERRAEAARAETARAQEAADTAEAAARSLEAAAEAAARAEAEDRARAAGANAAADAAAIGASRQQLTNILLQNLVVSH
jgi:hypothetical protein